MDGPNGVRRDFCVENRGFRSRRVLQLQRRWFGTVSLPVKPISLAAGSARYTSLASTAQSVNARFQSPPTTIIEHSKCENRFAPRVATSSSIGGVDVRGSVGPF